MVSVIYDTLVRCKLPSIAYTAKVSPLVVCIHEFCGFVSWWLLYPHIAFTLHKAMNCDCQAIYYNFYPTTVMFTFI